MRIDGRIVALSFLACMILLISACSSPFIQKSDLGPASLSIALRVPALQRGSVLSVSRLLLPTTTAVTVQMYYADTLEHSVTIVPDAEGLYAHTFEELVTGSWRIVVAAEDAQGGYAGYDQTQDLTSGLNQISAVLFPSAPVSLVAGYNGTHSVAEGQSAIFAFSPPYAGTWTLSAPGAPGALAWGADGRALPGVSAGATTVRYPAAAAGSPVFFSVYAEAAAANVAPRLVRSPQGAQVVGFGTSGLAELMGPTAAGYHHAIRDMVELSDGSIIAVGEYYQVSSPDLTTGFVMKFSAGGGIDRDFGSYGWLVLDKYPQTRPTACAIQTISGIERVIVSGEAANDTGEDQDYFALRVNTSGAVDITYGNSVPKDGYYTYEANINGPVYAFAGKTAIDIQGRLILPANVDPVSFHGNVICVAADGSALDTGFGTGGYVQAIIANKRAEAVAIANDGSIFVASIRTSGANEVYVSRLSSSGGAATLSAGGGSEVYNSTDSLMYPGLGVLSIGNIVVTSSSGSEVVYLAGTESVSVDKNMLLTALDSSTGALLYGPGAIGDFNAGLWKSIGLNVNVSDLIIDASGNMFIVASNNNSPYKSLATRILHNNGVPERDTDFSFTTAKEFEAVSMSGTEIVHAALLSRDGSTLVFGGSVNMPTQENETLIFRHPNGAGSVSGAYRTPLILSETFITDTVVLVDGSIVAVGVWGEYGVVVKFDSLGRADTVFNTTGFKTYYDAAFYSVGIAPDTGNIIAVGYTGGDAFAWSLNQATGAPIAQWGTDMAIFAPGLRFSSVAFASDNATILLGADLSGPYTESVYRYSVSGSPDFFLEIATTSDANFKPGSIAALPDGSLVASSWVGTSAGLVAVSYDPLGSPYFTLGGSVQLSPTLLPNRTKIAIHDDDYFVVGRPALAGNLQPYVARFSISGGTPSLDWQQHFSGITSTMSDFNYGIVAHPDGRVLVAGVEQPDPGVLVATGYLLALDGETGSLDSSFGINGRYNLNNPRSSVNLLTSLAVAPDGDLVVGGFALDSGGNKAGIVSQLR